MTDHLPECQVVDRRGTINPSDCICDRLSAAYKRGCALARGEAIEHYQQGYAAALDAAREAVATLPRLTGVEAALAAIDTLRATD